jgi:MATE family multidrug resistance protein
MQPAARETIATHTRQTFALAAPIALASLGQMAMAVTDTVMLGGISADALAAGGLGANLFFTCLWWLQGITSGVAVLAARARGAGRPQDVPGAYWSGIAIAAALAVPFFWLMSDPLPLLRLAGEPPALAADIARYLDVLRWGVPAGLVSFGVLRSFLPAVDLPQLMLWVTPGSVLTNLVFNTWFIRGGLGLPAFGMRGSAAATTLTLWLGAGALLLLLHGARHRHHVRATVPRLRVVAEMLAIGLPVSMTVLVEAGLFFATALMIGALGPGPLAAHQVAISAASITFMVPLSISQAANVRVAHAAGAGSFAGARRAAWVALAMAAGFMLSTALVLEAAPGAIARLYLPAASMALPGAVVLLRLAGVFQVFDGVQVTAAGALRGLKDTRVPMLLAAFGYWGIGFWLGRALAFHWSLGAAGLWCGLVAGLATSAICLTLRLWLVLRAAKASNTCGYKC